MALNMKTVSPHKLSIIIYAEDPGALNGLLPMAEQLTKAGFSVHMELDGYAATIDFIETEHVHKVFKCEENLKRNIYSGLLIGTSENKTSRAFSLILSFRVLLLLVLRFVSIFFSKSTSSHTNRSGSLGLIPVHPINLWR